MKFCLKFSFVFYAIVSFFNLAYGQTNSYVRIVANDIYYDSIQAAYNAASNGDIIQVQNRWFIENLNFNRGITINIQGGYDSDFTAVSSGAESIIFGSVEFTAGKITTSNLLVTGIGRPNTPTDTILPQISNLSPVNNSILSNSQPEIRADLSDQDSGIDISTLKVILDSANITSQVTIVPQGFSYTPALGLADGGHSLNIEIKDKAGNTAQVNSNFTTSSIPAPDSSVLTTATAGDTQVELIWTSVSGATGYKIKYGTTSANYASEIDVGNLTNYTVTDLINTTTYYFVIRAYNILESTNSNELSAMPQGILPESTTLTKVASGNSLVELSWLTVDGAVGYRVKYGTSSNNYSETINVGNTTNYIVINLTNNTTYYFVVTAYNNNGQSGNSNELSAIPQENAPLGQGYLVRISGDSTNYTSIQEAYNFANDQDIIQIQNGWFEEDLLFNHNITVTIEGGYTSDFAQRTSEKSVIIGDIKVSGGKLTTKNLIITSWDSSHAPDDTEPPFIISAYPVNGTVVASQGESFTSVSIVFGDNLSGVNIAKTKLYDSQDNDITNQANITANTINFLVETPPGSENTNHGFRLYLEDKSGNGISNNFSFMVDATIPEIKANKRGGKYLYPIIVKLQCSEPATIYYSTDGYPSFEGAPNTTKRQATQVDVAIDSTTNLQFFAVDLAGNKSETKREIYILDELPDIVSGVEGFYNETEKRAELQWFHHSQAVGYHVYRVVNIHEINILRDSTMSGYAPAPQLRISQSLVADTYFYDSSLVKGITYWYGITAIDSQGHESPISKLILVEVPVTTTAATPQEAIDRGLMWVEATQSLDGSWGNIREEHMLATSQILNAFKSANKDNLWVRRGVFYLRGHLSDNNDYLSRKILTLHKYGQNVDREINQLVAQAQFGKNSWYMDVLDGWGMYSYHRYDALDTALGRLANACRQGLAVGVNDFRNYTDERLLGIPPQDAASLQSQDGRYGWVPRKDTGIYVSALVYYSLQAAQSSYQWILDSQNSNGSFGNGLIDTSAVLLWLPLADPAKTNAISYLVSQQNLNGSWNSSDAYVTGLCLEAILKNN